MSFNTLLRLLSALFRRFTQVCRQLNIVDYSKQFLSPILVALRQLFCLHSASNHKPGPLPTYKSSIPVVNPNANVIVTGRESGTTTDVPITSCKLEVSLPHEEDLSRLEEGQQDHLEIALISGAHLLNEEFPQSTYDTPEEQAWLRSPL